MSFNQKGFTPIFFIYGILVLLIIGMVIYKLYPPVKPEQNNIVYAPSPTPILLKNLPILDKTDPTNLVIAKYVQASDSAGVTADLDPNLGQIVLKIPAGAQIINPAGSPVPSATYLTNFKLKVGQAIYGINTNANPEGLCPIGPEDTSGCGSDDDGIYRIWKDKTGKTAISIDGLNVDGYSSGIIIISKQGSHFTQVDIDLWKSIIESAKVYKSDYYEDYKQ